MRPTVIDRGRSAMPNLRDVIFFKLSMSDFLLG